MPAALLQRDDIGRQLQSRCQPLSYKGTRWGVSYRADASRSPTEGRDGASATEQMPAALLQRNEMGRQLQSRCQPLSYRGTRWGVSYRADASRSPTEERDGASATEQMPAALLQRDEMGRQLQSRSQSLTYSRPQERPSQRLGNSVMRWCTVVITSNRAQYTFLMSYEQVTLINLIGLTFKIFTPLLCKHMLQIVTLSLFNVDFKFSIINRDDLYKL